jgi:hypothetical protein
MLDPYNLLVYSIISQAIKDYAVSLDRIAIERDLQVEILEKGKGDKFLKRLARLSNVNEMRDFTNSVPDTRSRAVCEKYLTTCYRLSRYSELRDECITFFKSSWCEFLTGLDSYSMMLRVNKKIALKDISVLGYEKREAVGVTALKNTFTSV